MNLRLRAFFYDWTPARALGFVGVLALIALVLFAWTNIGAGPAQDVKSIVKSVGMDTGTKFTLPRYMATVETATGETALIEVPKSVLLAEGSEVMVRKTPRLLTNGYEYQFMSLVK